MFTLLLCLGLIPAYSGAAVDHQLFTKVLQDHVLDGLVDYAALGDDVRLDQYLGQLSQTNPAELPTVDEQLTLWINAYNAYTLKLVADAYPIESIHDLGTGGRILGWLLNKSPWDIRFAEVGGEEYTLNEIEHEILRVDFDEPRIHFAVVCAAISCPPLRSKAYVPERFDEQLDAQARQFVADRRSNRFNLSWQRAEVSPIFSWFEEDFGDDDSAVLLFLAEVAPPTTGEAIRQAPGKSDRLIVAFSGADTDGGFHGKHEHFAVPDFPGFSTLRDRVDRTGNQIIRYHDFDGRFGQKIYDVFAATIDFGVSFLATETLDFAHGHSRYPQFAEGFANLLELVGFDDGFDEFHRAGKLE